MPRRIVVLLLLHLLQLLPLLQTLHLLHPVLKLGTSVTTAIGEIIPLRNALTDAVIFKLRLTSSTLPYLPISRDSPALPVVRMKATKFHHLPVLRGLPLSLQLEHHLWLIDLQLQGLPDHRRCLHLLPLRLLTSSSSTKFQEISSSSFPTPARTLPKFIPEGCHGLGGLWVSNSTVTRFLP